MPVAGRRRGRFERKPAKCRGCGEELFVLTRFSPHPRSDRGDCYGGVSVSDRRHTGPSRQRHRTQPRDRQDRRKTPDRDPMAAATALRARQTADLPTGGATKTDSRGPPRVGNG